VSRQDVFFPLDTEEKLEEYFRYRKWLPFSDRQLRLVNIAFENLSAPPDLAEVASEMRNQVREEISVRKRLPSL
jgi:hypothetical protein